MPTTNLQTMLCAMDAVEALKNKKELLESAANIDTKKEKIKEELRRIYASQSIAVTEEILEAGVEETFQNSYRFKEPNSKLKERIALFLINGALQRKIGYSAIALALIGITSFGVLQSIERNQLKKVAEMAQALESQAASLSQELEKFPRTLAGTPLASANTTLLAAAQTLDVRGFPDNIIQAESFLQKARLLPSSDGQSNLEKDRLLTQSREQLQSAGQKVKEMGELNAIFTNSKLVNGALLADKAIPEPVRQEAQLTTNNIIAAIQEANVAKAQELQQKLQGLQAIANQAKVLPSQLNAVINDIKRVSKDREVTNNAIELSTQAEYAISSGNYQEATVKLKQLQEIANELKVEYKLRIVSRPGVLSGVWRQPDGQTRGNSRRYYVIVEAVTPTGSILPQRIQSVETGQSKVVNLWGEEVSEAEFEAVKSDKLDNNIIDDNLFGEKSAGTLQPIFHKGVKANQTSQDHTSRRITSW